MVEPQNECQPALDTQATRRRRFGADDMTDNLGDALTLWALHDPAGARRDDGPNKPAWRSHRLRFDFCPPTSKIV